MTQRIKFITLVIFISASLHLGAAEIKLPGDPEDGGDAIVIVEGEDRTVYEYRSAGRLLMIKVVPKEGRPYYMVPADGSPHYNDLSDEEKLYPRWIILEW